AIIKSSAINETGPEQELDWINLWIDEGKIFAYGNDPNLRAEVYASYDSGTGLTTLQAIATEPNQAYSPSPRPGATVNNRPVLSWTKGDNASQHDVYFGADRTAVENATTSSPEYETRLGVATTSYDPFSDPCDYTLNTPYYWRIDEVNASGDPEWKGLVWDFKSADYISVDDFESYVTQADLWNVWDDYWTNGTGSEVFVETDANFVRSGTTSLKYLYDSGYVNKGTCYGSIATTDTTKLGLSSNWTASGVEALVLYFNGDAANSATSGDQLWLQLEDTSSNTGTVLYPNPNDLAVYTVAGTEWNIDLSDANFSGVSMANIDKIHIGFGGPTVGGDCKTGGSGNLYFDDIALLPQRCVPAYGPAMDLNGDCIVNMDELELVIDDWLLHGFDVNSEVPPNSPLVHFTFDSDSGAGLVVTNEGSLGSAGNGSIIDFYSKGPGGPLTWETPGANHPGGSDPNYCIQLSGYIDQWVEVNDFNSIVGGGFTTNKLTISAWIKRSGDQYEWTGLVGSIDTLPADDPDPHAMLALGANDDWTPDPTPALNTLAYHWASVPDACDATPDGWDQIWWWRSGLLVPDGQWTFCAVSIQPEEASMYMMPAGGVFQKSTNIETHLPAAFDEVWNIGRDARTLWGNRTFNGQIDDVRIYDYALSDSEVLNVAGVASTHVPVPSNVDFDSSDDIDFVDYGYIADQWLVETLWP
ncbi:MAG: LamG domain-containing protein, partial [Planctomycetota bacterium]